jgi:carbon storage regulator
MLVLARKEKQRIFIGKDVTLTVVRIDAGEVRLGIEAPENTCIWREEVFDTKVKKFIADKEQEK